MIWWIWSQTPAACQSRKRFQQVMPQPQPISWGKSSQGQAGLEDEDDPGEDLVDVQERSSAFGLRGWGGVRAVGSGPRVRPEATAWP